MPTIIQLPPLREDRKRESASRNGAADDSTQSLASDYRLHKNPFSLLDAEIDTERERLRRRESLWISLAVHAALILLLIYAMPKLAASRDAKMSRLAEMLQNHDLTFLQAPPTPKPETPKDTNKISDQDRVARSRRPTLDEKTLRELQDSARAGAPAPAPKPAPGSQASAPQAPVQPAQNGSANNPSSNGQLARLESPPQPKAGAGRSAFGGPVSASSAIEQAVRGAAESRKGYSGTGGEYGMGPIQQQTKLRSDYDVLSDTLGVDFGPYLARILHAIRQNWYNIIPDEARAPLMKSGKVSIDFVIKKDGRIDGIRMASPSGDVALDRAAWGGITASDPFQPLPAEFRGQYLALRLHFFYNPDKSDLR